MFWRVPLGRTYPRGSLAGAKSVPSGLGSGLEAFSRNPTLGSIAALAYQLTADTREVKWEFLSYYPILPSAHPSIHQTELRFHSISRVKPTCLTTV